VSAGPAGAALRLAAPAKINLVLELLGPRPDGYTEIDTIFSPLELADDVEVTLAPGAARVELDVSPSPPCPGPENLAWRAARAYLEQSGLVRTVQLRLVKRIPPGAGLGGGSSDAGAVLRGLDRLTGGAVPPAELARLAGALGADVPYFLELGVCRGRGRGEQLEPLAPLPAWPVLLVMPPVHLATAEVYRRARGRLTHRAVPPTIRRFLRHLGQRQGGLPPVGNDLEASAAELCPEIPALVRTMEGWGARAAMTGSGSAVFGLFDDEDDAERAHQAARDRWSDHWICLSRLRSEPRAAVEPRR
jgi:4-diphosphocytidyl-2-C-methyl-D-erythritol kinase